MCFHCIVSVKRLRRAQSPNIQKLLEGKIIVYLFRITADLHICLDIGVEKAFPGRQENSGGIAAGAVQQPAVKLEQQRNQSTSLGQFIEHTKRDVWGFINILVHLAFSASIVFSLPSTTYKFLRFNQFSQSACFEQRTALCGVIFLLFQRCEAYQSKSLISQFSQINAIKQLYELLQCSGQHTGLQIPQTSVRIRIGALLQLFPKLYIRCSFILI
ncbi:Hypothetical_protein [Hexamita inflata]|uniref:Hypothetical_protein n=1 Tax=Hexamita inflata TaxID=28002 RepID=A0ABP1L123_9EUKA